MADTHKHKCPSCGCVWQHTRTSFFCAPGMHDCPKCGTHEGMIYRGDEPAEFINHHLKKREAGRA